MSKRTAAAQAAPLSEGRWRQLESGGRAIRGMWIPEPAPDPVLARMAFAVRLAPEDIRPFSERAAQILTDMVAERDAARSRDAGDAARMVDSLDGREMTVRQRAVLEADVTEALRRLRD